MASGGGGQPEVVLADASHANQNYRVPLIALGILYFMMGFITCLNDTLVPFFKKDFVLTYSESSLVQFYFFLTYAVMSIPAGKIVSKIGYQQGMVLGFGIAAVGAFLFVPASLLHQYVLFLAALFVLAIGIVILQVAANPYITILGPRATASARLTLIQGVGSVGTTVAPLFGAYFILANLQVSEAGSQVVKYPYLGIGLVLLIIAVVVSRLKLPALQSSASVETVKTNRSVFSYRNLNFGIAAIFCYVGAEVAVGTFLTNYIGDTMKIDPEHANSYVSFYWGAMLVGRLIGVVVLKRFKPGNVLTLSGLMAVALIAVSILSTGQLAVWTMIGVGLANSMMFAIIFSLAVDGLGKFTSQASGLLSTAIAGGAIISYAQGYLVDHYSWKIAFSLPLVCYAYLIYYGMKGHQSQLKTA